jgi:predicted amidohydrolase YtcJ
MTAALAGLAALVLAASPADEVLTGGRFYTVNPSHPWAQAVAIRSGRIVYVGDDAGAAAFVGPKTARHALGGRLVLPGLIDAHTHPGLVSGSKDFFLLPSTLDPAALAAEVERQARLHPETKLLIGGYWPIAAFGIEGPRKEVLDRVVGDRPVILFDDSGHSQWLNSKALALVGVDRNTKDPVPGLSFFVRDATGEATGWVKENALRPLLGEVKAGAAVQKDELEAFLRDLVSKGVVAVFDAGNGESDESVFAAVSELDRAGRLPLRYDASVMITLPEQLPGVVARLERLRDRYARGRLRINTVKILFDGVSEIGTSSVLEPFVDGTHGGTVISGAQLSDLLFELNRKRIDLHLHTVGDAATRTALDAVEAVRARVGGPLDSRVTLCHLEVQSAPDIPRFAALGVVASFTPHWNGGYFQGADRWLGRERYERMYSVKPLLRAGATVSFSSDITDHVEWKTDRANPFFGMQVGHTRQEPGEGAPAEVRPPADERLSREELVRGYTQGAAFQLRYEKDLGSIEAGKSADLVVLDRDLFAVDAGDIHAVTPTAVVIEGRLVHGALP